MNLHASTLAIAPIVLHSIGCVSVPTGVDDDGAPLPPNPEVPLLRPEDPPCDLDPEPRGLLVTTTDFVTGGVTTVELASRRVDADVALGSSDAIPFWHAGRAYVVHRLGFDAIDVLDPRDRFRSLGQYPLARPGIASTNPQAIAFTADGLAWVTLLGAPELAILDLAQPPGAAERGRVALSEFADDDGNPEASVIVACGDWVLAGVERLDPDWARVDVDMLAPIDARTRTARDLDPEREGGQGYVLGGAWLKQLRRDPKDERGHTLLALTSGIERIDLETGVVEWVVTPARLAAVGITHFMLPLAFDVDDAGEYAYLAAYGSDPEHPSDCAAELGDCFDEARIFEISLSTDAPPRLLARDLDASDRTLEVVGDTLWFASRRRHAPGVWIFSLGEPHGPAPVLAGPLATGLPPYGMTVIGAP